MRIALTGASGIVGHFVHRAALAQGHAVTALSRATGYSLGDAPDLTGHDAVIHCAFAHVQGRYRGGEGDDPASFVRANLDGSIRLFDAAVASGVERVVFLSSRAVHDGHPAGTSLTDTTPAAPTSVYAQAKTAVEEYLQGHPGLRATSVRATGVYGPGRANKWQGLFADYLSGRPIPPRVATEIHGDDLAAAILTALAADEAPAIVNASDLILDRHDLLSMVADRTGIDLPLPPRADHAGMGVLECGALRALGWRPGGMDLLARTLPHLLDPRALL